MKANFAAFIIAALVGSASATLCACYTKHERGAYFNESLSAACCQKVKETKLTSTYRCDVGSGDQVEHYAECCCGDVLEEEDCPSKTFAFCW